VLAKSGDRVMKGQVLAQLQSDSARDELLLAQTEFAAMQARAGQADADVTEARAALLRAKAIPNPARMTGHKPTLRAQPLGQANCRLSFARRWPRWRRLRAAHRQSYREGTLRRNRP